MQEPLRYSTPRAVAIDSVLRERTGEGLIDAVTRFRAQHTSWRTIASYIHEQTGDDVTGESVRTWADRWGIREHNGAAA